MRFSLLGVRVEVSFPFTATLALMILCDRSGTLSHAFLAAVLHELAHLAAMLICHAKPNAVRFRVGTVEIDAPHRPMRIGAQVFISLSGPCANLLAGGVLMLLFAAVRRDVLAVGGVVQLCTGGFNLLPVIGLDGGTLVEVLSGNRQYARLTSALTVIAAAGCMLCFSPVAFAGMGMALSLLYICAMQLLRGTKIKKMKRKT